MRPGEEDSILRLFGNLDWIDVDANLADRRWAARQPVPALSPAYRPCRLRNRCHHRTVERPPLDSQRP